MTTTSPGPRTARVALLAVLFAIAGEALLTSGALLDLQLREGAIPAAIAALVTYVLPGVVVAALVLATRSGTSGRPLGRTVLAGVITLAVARLVLQALTEMPRYVLGLATVAVAIAVLLLAVVLTAAGGGDRTGGGGDRATRDTASGLVLGMGLFAAVSGLTGTWNAVWRPDALGWVVAVGLVGVAVRAAWRLRDDEALERPRGLWVLGPVLGVGVFALASPAFLGSQSQVTPELHPSSGALPALIALTAWATTRLLNRRAGLSARMLRLGAVLPVLVGLTYVLPEHIGWSPVPVIIVLLATIPAVALLLVAVLGRKTRPTGRFTLAGLGVGVGLGAIVPLLVYQIDYDIPLGFPNALVIVAATLLIVLGSRVWQPSFAAAVPGREPPEQRLAGAAMPATAVVVVSAFGIWQAMPFLFTEERTPGTELTVVSWNVHYGVTPEVAVDLEAFARAIEAEDPDVVALQEISRGWLLGAGTDIATWLSHRLQMGVVYGHAADRQFGNALLSRYELTDVAVTQLPYGDGPMRRSAITATVTLADGTPVRVSSMHLQHKEENTPTRLAQLDAAIADIVPSGPSILAGDLNARPGWPEIAAMEGAGWISAIDTVGDPTALTFSTWDPVERIDWVFGQHVVFDRAEVMADASSDHFGIVVRAVPAP